MRREPRTQTSDSLLLGALLTLCGGYLDACTYLARGGVFAMAQTGNMILLSIHLAQREWSEGLRYLVPILAFSAGVWTAELVRRKDQTGGRVHWRQIVVGMEVLILLAAALLPTGRWDALANLMVSFLCAMQVESFRKVNGYAYTATMCTGNLRSGMEMLFRAFVAEDRGAREAAKHYLIILLCFVTGSGLGAVCTLHLGLGQLAVLPCCAALAASVLLMCRERM